MATQYIDAQIRNATLHSKGVVSDHIEIYEDLGQERSLGYSVILRREFNAHFGPERLETNMHSEPVRTFWRSYEGIGETMRGWKQRQALGNGLHYLDALTLAMQEGEAQKLPVYSSVDGENRVIWHPQEWSPVYEHGCRNQKPHYFIESHCDGDL